MHRRYVLTTAILAAIALAQPAAAQRARGIDVSAWQGSLTQTNWNDVAGSGIEFAFIRASRGGTTGEYNQSTRVGTLSHRYDDPYFVQNMTRASAAGILVGPYHFARPDLILGKVDMNGFDSTATSNPVDEANHFLEQAGQYMRPGYIRPVFDLEGGASQYTKAALTDYALAFSDRILAVTGVRPIVYINSSYANNEVDTRLNTHDLWLARYIDPTTVDVQTSDPPAASGYPNVYGVWNPTYPTMPAVKPWDFWQYTSTGRVPGIGGGNANVDMNVANGGMEFVKDFLVPALWTTDARGEWTTASNWNGVTKTPQPIDRVIINRPTASTTVTLSSGTHHIRSLQSSETIVISGGQLNIAQYANLTQYAVVSGGSLTADTIVTTNTLGIASGAITARTITGTGRISAEGGLVRVGSVDLADIGAYGGKVQLTSSATSVTKSLTTLGAASLDIGTAKLIVDYAATAASPITTIREALFDGEIVRSNAPAGVSVAYFQASDLFTSFPATFGGKSIDASSVLLTSALRGDTDLSGTVNFADLVTLAQSYNGTGRWRQGDFNYDGTINFADLVSLAQNYNGTLGATVASRSSSFQSDWALAQSLVPEPTAALALLALSSRRRRR